ncbi:crotonobetainyl-CoA:carnitine CoA-transferase CaiB-like acyl-CoA transferase [Mycobacterium frederiksbergense]|uniref:Crotonobetainyl-CoA:carnitine CoA-transferase CaiB-like acyl-CoA transferase n=1 Tax=Mycolicibacterium frederiksbergense TaxID=117567 RepID=A0ABT6L4H4_9MYCO|nr:CoA transferase [Mycolicibacterium frederiksbergense]MDH6197829.1 crotonobetainyl-CoA:carnitine CoA-transferase CaiB-like acyl-CoA transferase [Mycolicibacterium frederiksbergense]
MSEVPAGALAGLRVLDATQMLAGPIAGMRLGDLGADVIKIEGLNGEFNRSHGYADVDLKGHTTTFLGLNRNKRSLAVDLKNDRGREVFYDLVRHSDVFIQNFRAGTVDRLGVDWDTLRGINPRLVYASISGYGSTGPGAERPGQDLVLQGYSGSMWFVGTEDQPPSPGGIPAIDAMTGYQAVVAILAALIARSNSGQGQHVEVDMLSVVMDAQIQELVTYLNAGVLPRRSAEHTAHAWIGAPYGVYQTSDGWLTLAMCPIDKLGQALGEQRLNDYTDVRDAQRHADQIYAIVRPHFTKRSTQEWIELLDTYNIWSGPVYTYADLESDPHVQARELVQTMQHPDAGTVRTVAPPIRMSRNKVAIRKAPPLLGADTRSILVDLLGYDTSSVDELIASRAVGTADCEEDAQR